MKTGHRDDIRHMRHALRLAERGLGDVAPNPSVGCVIVSRDGRVVGRGWTQTGGRPHAETVALAQAGEQARGACVYVTLEPCAHHGQTPPCANALIAAGVSRVVGAISDPDPRVAGAGFARLENAGIEVTRGVLEAEAGALNHGFFKRVTEGRPMVALKIAQSADGYVADAHGNSKWITGERARAHGHLMRAKHDAILVGLGTVLADDPALTCRLPGLESRSPTRIVLDSKLQIPAGSQLVRTAKERPVIVFTTAKDGGEALSATGVQIERVAADKEGRPDVAVVLQTLGNRGLTRVLVEGGPAIHAAFLKRNLADMIHIYRAPLLIGEGGRPAIASFGKVPLNAGPRLKLLERTLLDPDILESFALTV
ncbi:MAG TPA: bifunctional diaminohydroxyphosphoribosylaminopyrimidine deaminase/5-amino-6-(5-phosphoribosylamino)uracil reductase RibD [Micropepsaceae bacterium]|nr:bifunctional diaminohydroxyphosphoribosylaminopyrimidine deaminase/5-amino-6-(5-phosphoribosylamino)uracil reductase RibD [Micropepsaceae bacterium]